MSLLYRLFHHRERVGYSPKENFLTEAAAELLNILPRTEMETVLRRHFLPAAAWSTFHQCIEGCSLVWRSQVPIEWGGRKGQIDLLLEANGTPVLAVESKIGALLAPDQLQRYGRWLAERSRGMPWPGALTLLTHWTAAPIDFETSTPEYGVAWRRVCHWSEFHRALRLLVGRPLDPLPAWCFLARELSQFIEEHNMAAETITSADLALIELYARAAGRLSATFDIVCQRTKTALEGKVKEPRGMIFNSEGLCVWEWAYFADDLVPGQRAHWFAYWGIVFPGTSDWWGTARPIERSAVVGVGADRDRPGNIAMPVGRLPLNAIPGGWQIADQDLLAFRPFSDFVPGDGELAEGLAEWVATQLAVAPKLATLLRDIVRNDGT